MSKNPYVLQRLHGIQTQLMGGYRAGTAMSAAARGQEREAFIDRFLAEVFPNHFRFGTGDATDRRGNKSGQLDVVIEFPFGPSLPTVGGASTRLYLAETVAAVIEVKSDCAAGWGDAVDTARKLFPLERSYSAMIMMGEALPKIPLFVAGYTGWKQLSTLKQHLAEAPEVSGILVIEPGIFAASPQFGEIYATGPWALWALIACLHHASGFLKAAGTNPLEYAVDTPEDTPRAGQGTPPDDRPRGG